MSVDPDHLSDPKLLRNLLQNAAKASRKDLVLKCQVRLAKLEGALYGTALEREFWAAVAAAEELASQKNGKKTPMVAHTLNPVPFIVKDYNGANRFRLSGVENPGLANIAATLCVLLGFQPPGDYEPALLELEP